MYTSSQNNKYIYIYTHTQACVHLCVCTLTRTHSLHVHLTINIGSLWKIKVSILDSNRMLRTLKHFVSHVGSLTIISGRFQDFAYLLFFDNNEANLFFLFLFFFFHQFSQ
jgi:hypothetical protein